MSRKKIIGRFAPSPTGRMHLGNVFSALISYLSAKSQGGEWVLRIEDLDRGRCKPEYIDLLKRDLEFLGLEWDRGGEGEWCQSARSEHYERALSMLEEKGLTYPCWCTRAELMAASAPHESDGRIIYPGTCRDNAERVALNAGRPAATRIMVPDEVIKFTDGHYGPQEVALASSCGDFVLRRSDGAWAYQLAVVVDDALMGVTEVVRGRDLLLSAAQQLFLFNVLGYTAPSYCHFPLLCNSLGQRLSKRDAALDMGALRERYSAGEIISILAHYAGLLPSGGTCHSDTVQHDKIEPCTPQDLIPLFDWSKVPTKDIIVQVNDRMKRL